MFADLGLLSSLTPQFLFELIHSPALHVQHVFHLVLPGLVVIVLSEQLLVLQLDRFHLPLKLVGVVIHFILLAVHFLKKLFIFYPLLLDLSFQILLLLLDRLVHLLGVLVNVLSHPLYLPVRIRYQ